MDPNSPCLLTTYDEWLALSTEQKEEHKSHWNPYAGEGRAIPMMAAARLMWSDPRIKDIVVGIYHGAEYILRPTVSNEDFKNCRRWGPPSETIETFEGFRIYWTKESYEFNPQDVAPFIGVWKCETQECDAEFTIDLVQNEIEISGHCPSINKALDVKVLLFDGWRLQFEVALPNSSQTCTHWFQSREEGRCIDDMIVSLLWKRVEKAK